VFSGTPGLSNKVPSLGSLRVGSLEEIELQSAAPAGFRFAQLRLAVLPSHDQVISKVSLETRSAASFDPHGTGAKAELKVPLKLRKGKRVDGVLVFRIPVGGDYSLRLVLDGGREILIPVGAPAEVTVDDAARAYLKLVTAANKKQDALRPVFNSAGCSSAKLGKAYARAARVDEEFLEKLSDIKFPSSAINSVRRLQRNVAAQVTVERQLAGDPLDARFRYRIRTLLDRHSELAPLVRQALGLRPVIASDAEWTNDCAY
jgi:hypothetical protein